MKSMAASMFVVALSLFGSGAHAFGPTLHWSDSAQLSAEFGTEMSSCSSFQKIHLKVKNNSGKIDFFAILEKQCYKIVVSTFGKKRREPAFSSKPVSVDRVEVCSGETMELDSTPFRKGEYEVFKIVGEVSNDKPLFPKLGSCDVELTAVTYPIEDHILFAHGLGSTKKDFDNFTSAAELVGAKVYRYDVGRCASIDARAEELAKKIATNNIPDNSLKVVGHSMGGLDLRYLVSRADGMNERFLPAAKKIKKVYTIATPHGGNAFADKVPGLACTGSDGMADLSEVCMKAFNRYFPYSSFKVDGRSIPFLAFSFQCWSCGGENDCAVGTGSQVWKGAPQHTPVLSGKHSNDLFTGLVGTGCTAELDNIDEVLCTILNDR